MSASRAIPPAIGLLLLCLAAGALRAGSDVLVVQADGVHFTVPGDPYYHMRRIAYTVERFPAVLSFDRYLNHPHGGQVVWPPAFDWSVAAAARLVAGADDPRGVERVAARAPAVIGTLAVAGVVWLGRRRFGPLAGWVAGALLAVLPNHLLHSQVGQLDHHVAVSAFAVVLLAAAMALARAARPSLRMGLGVGLAFAAGILLWPGMLIHVGLLDAMLVAWVLAADAPDPAEGRRLASGRARALAAANAIAFAGVAPFALGRTWTEFGAFSPWVLSSFQPVFFLAAAVTLGAAALGFERPGLGATRARRLVLAAALGAAGLGAAFLAIPDLGHVLGVAAGWFAKDEAFQENVSELQPFYPAVAASRLSLLVFAFPLAWAWLLWRSWREGAAADRFVLLGLAAGFFALAALQRRFGNTFSILYALVWGWLAAEALPRARAALAARPRWRWPALGAAALGALLVADSLLAFHGPRQVALAEARRNPARAEKGPLGVRHRLFDAASVWLGQSSPATSGWLDPEAIPEYGVLASWDAGHMIRYRARRPLVQDNFGVYGGRESYEAAARYFAAEDEAEALAILGRLGVRYVLADRGGAGGRLPDSPRAMARRLVTGFGSAGEAGAEGPEVPALAHHRLLWHERSGEGRELEASGKDHALGIFEIVPGARVVGRAAPGARVEARMALRTAVGRVHPYRAHARADARGRFELVLPYPTDRPWSAALHGEGHYELASGEGHARLEVPEAAIRAGGEIAAPDLRPAAGSPIGSGG